MKAGEATVKKVALNEVADFFADGDWIESKDQSPAGFRLVQTGNIGVGRYLEHPDRARYVSAETFKRLNCTQLKTGDILISRLPDPVGRACIFPGGYDAITAVDCTIVRVNSRLALPTWVHYFSQTEEYQRQVDAMLGGSTRLRITRKELGGIKIPLPPLAEQRKIAEILRTWDEAIETAEAELKAKQERKRWLMDRLFKFSPESHLEQVKMQDAVDVLKGEQLNRHTLAEKGSYPVWNGGITPSGYTESFNTEGPAVIMSEGGNSCGAITRVNENFWRGGHCYHVVPRNGFSNGYLFAALKYYEPQIMRLRVGSGLPNIQKKTFLSWGTPLHKPAYRDKVASVFSHAQHEGELANKYIETLRAQKRGLMQKLLTGEIRVSA